jgi:hypothetical protein
MAHRKQDIIQLVARKVSQKVGLILDQIWGSYQMSLSFYLTSQGIMSTGDSVKSSDLL